MTISLALRPLTTDDFAPYGDVLPLAQGDSRSINAGTSARRDLPSRIDLARQGGQPVLATFEARAQPLAGPWRLLERHAFGSQTFVPLAAGRWILLVARGGDTPDLASLAAFEAGPRQGVTLHAGTWHHPLIALDDGLFLVLERQGAVEDCDVVQLETPVRLHAA